MGMWRGSSVRNIILVAALCYLFCAETNAFNGSTLPRRHTSGAIQSPDRISPTSWSLSDASVGTNANDLLPMNKGSTVALITPMLEDAPHEVDMEAYKSLLQYHLDSGTDGLCILGTTGEASTLTFEERSSIITQTVDMCKGKVPILVGCGTIDPKSVRAQILQSRDLGADAVMVVTPYYVKPPQRGLLRHFTTAADLGMPTVLYNVPGRTGIDCIPTTLAECANHPNIVAVKEATGDVSRVQKILSSMTDSARDSTLLLSGDDGTSVDFVKAGGHGCISVTANVAPKAMHEVMEACLRGDYDTAQKINDPIQLLHSDLFCEANPIPAKWALERMRKIPNGIARPPLDKLDPQYRALVEKALQAAKLI